MQIINFIKICNENMLVIPSRIKFLNKKVSYFMVQSGLLDIRIQCRLPNGISTEYALLRLYMPIFYISTSLSKLTSFLQYHNLDKISMISLLSPTLNHKVLSISCLYIFAQVLISCAWAQKPIQSIIHAEQYL